MTDPASRSRRSFLRTAAAASVATVPLGNNVFALQANDQPKAEAGPNDRIRIATIGMGIIGFIDTNTALRVPGVELVAASDLYEGRRVRTKEVYGDHVDTYVDYREILDRDDVDAVLICVPDHWHAKMSIDAMKAGKAVYCEKPMVRLVDEGHEVIASEKATGAVFQVGSQCASSILYHKVKELIAAGAIGRINSIEARYNRNSDIGAMQYSIPTDASPETIDWDRFLGDAPKHDFDPVRFFRWRGYWDYGTATAGDLFVHLLTGIHHITNSLGPTQIAGMGGHRYWDDGREVYDIIMGLLDYPETSAHPAFTLMLQSNLEDGGGGNTLFRFVGDEGAINLGSTEMTLQRVGIRTASADQVLKGYNSVRTFSEAEQKRFAEQFLAERRAEAPQAKPEVEFEEKFVVPRGYDHRLDHFTNFFNCIREGSPVYEDATFGLRAAAPGLLCNESYRQGGIIHWDPKGMKVVSKSELS